MDWPSTTSGNLRRAQQVRRRGQVHQQGEGRALQGRQGVGVLEQVRWEDLEDRADRCPHCLHWWVNHGVRGEDYRGCTMRANSIAEQPIAFCGCTFADGSTVTPRQVRIWQDGTSWPPAPEARADCGHYRRGPIREDNSQQCLGCGVVFVSDG
jgi:hypothetical protein